MPVVLLLLPTHSLINMYENTSKILHSKRNGSNHFLDVMWLLPTSFTDDIMMTPLRRPLYLIWTLVSSFSGYLQNIRYRFVQHQLWLALTHTVLVIDSRKIFFLKDKIAINKICTSIFYWPLHCFGKKVYSNIMSFTFKMFCLFLV